MCIVVSLQSYKKQQAKLLHQLFKSEYNLCWLKVWEKHKSKYMTLLYNLMFAQQQDAGRKLELHSKTPAQLFTTVIYSCLVNF